MKLSSWFSLYKKPVLTIVGLVFALLGAAIISIGTGAVSIPPKTVILILLDNIGIISGDEQLVQYAAIVQGIRLPRVIMAILVGATLAVSGAALQGLFRNPLADPTLIGVSSGAAFFAACVIILGGTFLELLPSFLTTLSLPVAAFLGGLLATWLVYSISTKSGRTSVATMLLAGIAVNALAAAGIGMLVFTADDPQIRDLTFWTLGSLGSSTWSTVNSSLLFLMVPIIGLPILSKSMNVMMLGEQEANHLGIKTQLVKKSVILISAIGIGAAVAVSGIIGFVGLVVPHLLRLFMGPDNRFLIPASILLGALLLLASDLFARLIVVPAELPIGIVTSIIGAPFFLWLLMRNRSLANYL
jgi:iron complex transport system permease protein